MVLKQIQEAHFYAEWQDRFEEEWPELITTGDKKVISWAKDAMPRGNPSDREIAMATWLYVYNNTQYKLSEKWKTPRETIRSGIGDCEDFTFLISSMLPNMGVDNHTLALGEIEFPNGKREYHTWSVVGGLVIDATGTPEAVKRVNYHSVEKWGIEASNRGDKNGECATC